MSKLIQLIKYTGPNFDKSWDDVNAGLHLKGFSLELGSETLCGVVDSGSPQEVVEGIAPTCKSCISVAKEIFKRYSAAQVKSWRF